MNKVIENVKAERAEIQKHIDELRPHIERIAKTGTKEERRIARRWLSMDEGYRMGNQGIYQ